MDRQDRRTGDGEVSRQHTTEVTLSGSGREAEIIVTALNGLKALVDLQNITKAIKLAPGAAQEGKGAPPMLNEIEDLLRDIGNQKFNTEE